MRTFTAIFPPHHYPRVIQQQIRGICQFDVLNPCWDNRPTDVPGKHWGEGDACPACTKAAQEQIACA